MTPIQKAVKDYLAIRRALGFDLHHAGKLLDDFAAFMKGEHAPYVTEELAIRWARSAVAQPPRWGVRLGVVRMFAEYWAATDPRT